MIVTLPPYPPKRKLRGASLPDVVRSFEALQGNKKYLARLRDAKPKATTRLLTIYKT